MSGPHYLIGCQHNPVSTKSGQAHHPGECHEVDLAVGDTTSECSGRTGSVQAQEPTATVGAATEPWKKFENMCTPLGHSTSQRLVSPPQLASVRRPPVPAPKGAGELHPARASHLAGQRPTLRAAGQLAPNPLRHAGARSGFAAGRSCPDSAGCVEKHLKSQGDSGCALWAEPRTCSQAAPNGEQNGSPRSADRGLLLFHPRQAGGCAPGALGV
jgi:hypothetical protein